MDLIAKILGPKSEHRFIAEHFIFVCWGNENINIDENQNNELTIEESSWINALGFLNYPWFRSNENKKAITLFLPLDNGPNLLLSNKIIIHEKCKQIQFEEIPFILQARYELLQNFQKSLTVYKNFDLYKKWDLFRFVTDQEEKKKVCQEK